MSIVTNKVDAPKPTTPSKASQEPHMRPYKQKPFEFLFQGTGGGIGVITKAWSKAPYAQGISYADLPTNWEKSYVLLDAKNLLTAFSPLNTQSRLLLITASCGFGKTWVLEQIRRQYFERGAKTFFVDAAHFSKTELCAQLTHLKRLAQAVKHRDVLICIDNMHAAEETHVAEVTALVQELFDVHAIICISLDNNQDCLVEALIDVIPSLRILDQDTLSPTKLAQLPEVDLLTRNIPALTSALVADFALRQRGQITTHNYIAALRHIYKHELKCVADETEARMRHRMFLLGSGSFSDLIQIRQHSERDLLYDVARLAPIFGIDTLNRTFFTAGIERSYFLSAFGDILEDLAITQPQDFLFALKVLLRRGDIERLKYLLEICPNDACYLEFIFEHGVSLIYFGLLEEVRCAAQYVRETNALQMLHSDAYHRCCAAILELCGSGSELLANRELSLSASDYFTAPAQDQFEIAKLMLLRCMRWVCEGERVPADILSIAAIDEQTRQMCLAIQALQCLLKGHFSEAEQVLLTLRIDLGTQSISTIIIYSIYVLSTAVVGNIVDTNEICAWKEMQAWLKERKYIRLHKYLQLIPDLLGLIMGTLDNMASFEEVRKSANFAGDRVIETIACLAKALVSIRMMSPTMVTAALSRADTLLIDLEALESTTPSAKIRARRCVHHELVDYSILVTQILYWREGLKLYIGDEVRDIALQGLLRLLFALTQGDATKMQSILKHQLKDLDMRNHLWLLHVLTSDIGTTSTQFKNVLPNNWRALLPSGILAQRMANALSCASIVPKEAEIKISTDSNGSSAMTNSLSTMLHNSTPVFIQVMGGLTIYIGDTILTGTDIGPRMVRQFIMELAVRPGHSVTKPEIWELFWPGISDQRQRQRLYEICYKIRQLFAPFGIEDVVIAPRDSMRISLNLEICTVDLDIIEKETNYVLHSDATGADIFTNTDLIDELFKGGVYDKELILDERNIAHLEHLRKQFVSSLLISANRARINGYFSLAQNYLCRGRKLDPYREDLVIMQVEIYMDTKCFRDAKFIYTEYCQLLQNEGKARPLALEAKYRDAIKAALEQHVLPDDDATFYAPEDIQLNWETPDSAGDKPPAA